ncbi:amyloid protein-binding protein 2 [Periplaneta americana]|uniref:amyloid protein-binding protein 2 n=1 Tax=Periplaneta americana TaxID=6978 RepID=UPI0037E8DA72
MAPDEMRVPDSLYNLGIAAVIDNYQLFKNELRILPDNLMFDLYYKLYKEKRLCLLGVEFSDLDVFGRVLKITNRRMFLLKSFQALMDHGTRVAKDLVLAYGRKCSASLSYPVARDSTIDLGLRLGGFLSDAGWFAESEKVLLACREICQCAEPTVKYWRKLLECCHKLLHTQAAFCQFEGAEITYRLALDVVDRLHAANEETNLAGLFAEFSVLHFSRSEYDEAYRWSVEALKQVKPGLPSRVTIDVLRQVAKSCVVKREFKRAGLLARQAVYLTKDVFDKDHPKYSDSLLDFGFFLLNFDSIRQSVGVYETALDIRKAIFGKFNLHVAVAHEDLAYALYVYEYSSGRFLKAREHAEKAIIIMEKLLPEEHLMLASVKRVKALILEEIALDTMINNSGMHVLLSKAEDLHMSALKLAMATFGEKNVQTAKHFGNLGRLYQSMKKFQEAETMHLKAIAIKEELLGAEDYEVGLSIGHLASLYNYHMKKHKKAEQLYLRSIAISLKLFGESYSGLEYDYRGLVHVYHELEDVEKVAEYTYILNNWKLHRDLHAQREDPPIDQEEAPWAIEDIARQFFNGD